MANDSWYYLHDGQQAGPVSEEALKQQLREGRVWPDDLVWREGFSDWVPASRVPELSSAASASHSSGSGGISRGGPGATDANPYQSPADTTQPWEQSRGTAQGGHLVYAGFWKRVAAYILDSRILGIPLFATGFIVALALGADRMAVRDPDALSTLKLGLRAFGWIATWLYYAGMESSSQQGTLGKLALGIKVTDLRGNPIGFGQATGRFFAKILSGCLLGVGFLMVAFTDKKQGLHDQISGCLVVDRIPFGDSRPNSWDDPTRAPTAAFQSPPKPREELPPISLDDLGRFRRN